jgi:hypothetical protein
MSREKNVSAVVAVFQKKLLFTLLPFRKTRSVWLLVYIIFSFVFTLLLVLAHKIIGLASNISTSF